MRTRASRTQKATAAPPADFAPVRPVVCTATLPVTSQAEFWCARQRTLCATCEAAVLHGKLSTTLFL